MADTPDLGGDLAVDSARTDAPAAVPARSRRSPVQARSADTVRKVEEAASRLLARGVAVDAMTTAQISAEAQVSVGALYRFFPDKQAIVDGLAVRRLQDFQTRLARDIVPALAERNGPALVGFVIDAFVAFLDDNPDFATIAFKGRSISRGTREVQSNANAGVPELVKRYMTEVLGVAAAPELDLRLRLASEVGDRLIGLAMEQADVQARRPIIDEVKRMISLYLFGAG
jgi:AcrR family transcriptional regulator